MMIGRLVFASPPTSDAGTVPAAVPTYVPCNEALLHGPALAPAFASEMQPAKRKAEISPMVIGSITILLAPENGPRRRSGTITACSAGCCGSASGSSSVAQEWRAAPRGDHGNERPACPEAAGRDEERARERRIHRTGCLDNRLTREPKDAQPSR